jgi:putative intracellular protease/amidase
VLFPGFTALDVYGPMEALTGLSYTTYLANLSLIADTLAPVSGYYVPWFTPVKGSYFGSAVVPTHTFANPPDLDVLIVPGGLGTRAPVPYLNTTIDYVRSAFPKIKYLITVCTGAGIAARAGVLDGKHATTNKRAWAQTTAWGPKVKWVAQARWTVDGNVCE